MNGGFGNCPPGAPIYDATDPLTKLFSPNQAGKTGVVVPPPQIGQPDAEGRIFGAWVTGFNTMTGIDCAVGQWLAIGFDVDIVGDPESFVTLQPIVTGVQAKLTYGLGSAEFVEIVDCVRGTTLELSATTIGVEVRYVLQTDPGQAIPDIPLPPYVVSAGIGRGGSGQNSNGMRITEIRHLAAGQTKTIRIPRRAVSVNLQPSAGAVNARVSAFGTLYSTPYNVAAPLAGYQVENALPIFGGAEILSITNPGQAAIRVAVVFGMKL